MEFLLVIIQEYLIRSKQRWKLQYLKQYSKEHTTRTGKLAISSKCPNNGMNGMISHQSLYFV